MVVGHDRVLPEDPLQKLPSDKDSPVDILTKAVMGVETSVIGLSANLEEVAKATLKRFESDEADALMMAGVIQTIKANVGSMPPNMDPKFVSPTVWGSAAFIGEELIDVGLVAWAIDQEWKDFKVSVEDETDNFKMESERVVTVLTAVMDRIKEMGPELESVKHSLSVMKKEREEEREKKDSDTYRSAKKARFTDGRDRKDSVDDLSRLFDRTAVINVEGTPEKGSSTSTEEIPVSQAFEALERSVGTLISDVSLLKSGTDQETIKFANLGFKSVEDCDAWAKVNFKCRRYGLVMDPLLLLDRVCRKTDLTSKDSTWKAMEGKINMKITTGAEAAALEALKNLRPRLFRTGEPSMVYERNTSRLNKLMSHKDWKSAAGGGVREHIMKRLNALNASISQEINNTLGKDLTQRDAHLVATLSLTASVTSVTNLVIAVDSIYDKLHNQSKFSAEASWCLTMQILDKVVEELFVPKEEVMTSATLGDADSFCAYVLFSCFRTHDIMTDYVDLQFENHPSVSAEFIRFLATNSGSERVEVLEGKVAEQKISLKLATEKAEKAMAKADTATNKAADANRDLATAIRRIKALEDRPRNG